MMVESSIDRAVDDLGLKAGVRIAKGCRECHDGNELNDGFQRQSLRKSWRMRLSSAQFI